jgi:general stress protein YciG
MNESDQPKRATGETLKKKYGVDENGKSIFHKKIGAKGGRTSHLPLNRQRAQELGRKGGLGKAKARKAGE